MMFQVKFQLPNDRCLHIRNLTSTTGMDAINMVRSEIGVHVPTRNIKIQHSCPAFNNSTFNVFPSEVQLDKINEFGVFNAKSMITVIVPDGFLGQFWEMNISNTGILSSEYSFVKRMITLDQRKLSQYQVEFEINSNQLIIDWITASCPLIWTPRDIEINDSEYDPNIVYSTLMREGSNPYEYRNQSSRLIGDNIKDIVLTHDQFTKNDHELDKIICIIRNSDVPGIINLLIEKLSSQGLRQLITLAQDRLSEFEKNKH